jgi:hypothetical protein
MYVLFEIDTAVQNSPRASVIHQRDDHLALLFNKGKILMVASSIEIVEVNLSEGGIWIDKSWYSGATSRDSSPAIPNSHALVGDFPLMRGRTFSRYIAWQAMYRLDILHFLS